MPRLNAMFKARNKRRRQELREMGMVVAHAFHDPSKIDDLLKPPVEEVLSQSIRDDGAWEDDEWWRGVN